jgi:hypothetical protein
VKGIASDLDGWEYCFFEVLKRGEANLMKGVVLRTRQDAIMFL